MLRIFIFLVLLLPSLAAISGEENKHELLTPSEDEVKAIDHLIDATTEKLAVQKQLRQLMLELQVYEERFFKGDQSKQHAGTMVNTARKILDIITQLHIEHLFSQEYLQGLTLFSSIAGKNQQPKP